MSQHCQAGQGNVRDWAGLGVSSPVPQVKREGRASLTPKERGQKAGSRLSFQVAGEMGSTWEQSQAVGVLQPSHLLPCCRASEGSRVWACDQPVPVLPALTSIAFTWGGGMLGRSD